MIIKLSKKERKDLFKDLVDDEIKSLVRNEFQEKYYDILKSEIKVKIEQVIDTNTHLFRDSIKNNINEIAGSVVNENFMAKSGGSFGRGYFTSLNGKLFNDETKQLLVDTIYKDVKDDFDMETLTRDVKEKLINQLVKGVEK